MDSNPVYDLIFYQNGGSNLNVGRSIGRARVIDDTGTGINVFETTKQFFKQLDKSTFEVSEPVNLLIDKMTGNTVTDLSQMNDVLGTLRSFGYVYQIIKRLDITESAEPVDALATGYLLLNKTYDDSISVPTMFIGWAINFEQEMPTVAQMGQEILNLMSVPPTYGSYSGVADDKEYYRMMKENGELATYSNLSSFNFIESLGYTYSILLG